MVVSLNARLESKKEERRSCGEGGMRRVPCLCRRFSSNPSGECSYEQPTRDTVCGTIRSMCGADADCLAINYQSLRGRRHGAGAAPVRPEAGPVVPRRTGYAACARRNLSRSSVRGGLV